MVGEAWRGRPERTMVPIHLVRAVCLRSDSWNAPLPPHPSVFLADRPGASPHPAPRAGEALLLAPHPSRGKRSMRRSLIVSSALALVLFATSCDGSRQGSSASAAKPPAPASASGPHVPQVLPG